MFKIVSKREMAERTVCEFDIVAPDIARKAKPGQFVVIRANETGERIPLTMAGADPEAGTINIIFQVVGKTTALLRSFGEDGEILDIIGPLGVPTHVEKLGAVICVGGGTGVAVMYPITKAYKEAGNHVIAIIGARTKDLLILEEEMTAASHDLRVTTDDGSYGHHGFVTDVLKEILEGKGSDLVVAIGPVPMMKFTCDLTKKYNVKTVVSLNPIMVDGTGMCGCCRCTIDGKTKFACVDGPIFEAKDIDWDQLFKRNVSYSQQEAMIYQFHSCESEEGV